MNLNIGSGNIRHADTVNVDLRSEVADVVADARMLPFRDRSFRLVIAADVAEHLTVDHRDGLFAEWRRIMTSDGRLRLRVPNLKQLAATIMGAAGDALHVAIRNVYGGHRWGPDGSWDCHHWGWTPASIAVDLARAGFTIIDNDEAENMTIEAKAADTFTWHSETFDCCRDVYNDSGRNERTVEIPIARRFAEQRTGLGLEVGNVLSHYRTRARRLIVDRYEHGDGIINRDVFDIRWSFDWIVSVSTLEHVRWDEQPRLIEGAHAAIEHLVGLLRPGGRMLITVPTGWHPDIDDRICTGKMGADRESTFVRAGENRWTETPMPVVRAYGQPRWANGLWIGEWFR